ncbi:protein LURP-one-related 4-like [Juglans microcarpa x Juglans regia]|uniref:protein LURP-one-related 4-like n=1 Tax=Juglans microcarpa x Juglans regia TaxID=2249226 RepID=UPI001B7F35CE|nr:protein LURP-one-related 4-like [Juglans microcarpa x Juglans regia]
MAKVYSQDQPSSSSSPYMTSKRETFTLWMKSLVYQTNGCTVYNTIGDIVYRVDNYEKKGSSEVHLMDLRGKVLFTIRRKKFLAFGGWEGYRCRSSHGSCVNEEKPWFRVKKCYKSMLMGDLACQVTVGYDKYWIVRLVGKAAFRIVNTDGDIVAEAKPKHSSSGVLLGDDVLTLVVEPQMDHSLIMALVIVYGLIRRRV